MRKATEGMYQYQRARLCQGASCVLVCSSCMAVRVADRTPSTRADTPPDKLLG
eukprot:COSAG02_NODE_40207_length_408_cov_0.656958_1_plen_52_part_01